MRDMRILRAILQNKEGTSWYLPLFISLFIAIVTNTFIFSYIVKRGEQHEKKNHDACFDFVVFLLIRM